MRARYAVQQMFTSPSDVAMTTSGNCTISGTGVTTFAKEHLGANDGSYSSDDDFLRCNTGDKQNAQM